MAIDSQASHNMWRAARREARVILLAAASALVLAALLPISGVAQTPQSAPTMISPPSLPVRGPIIRGMPIPPGANVPTPGAEFPQHEHMIGITIDGEHFMMHPGQCVASVSSAIKAHDDLFTGNQVCDGFIRQARALQRRKEAEDPSYASEPRITPASSSTESGAGQNQQ